MSASLYAAVGIIILLFLGQIRPPTPQLTLILYVSFVCALRPFLVARGYAGTGSRMVCTIGIIFGMLIWGRIALYDGYESTVVSTDAVRIVAIRGDAGHDVFVDIPGTYGVELSPDTVADVDGTVLSGSSFSGTRVRVYLYLEDHLYRGASIEARGLSPVAEGGSRMFGSSSARRLGTYRNRFWELRARMFDRVNTVRYRLQPHSSALFAALFLGVSEPSLDDFRYFVRKCGCMHLLALSGMHIAVLIGMLSTVLSPFLGRKYAALVTIPVALFYVGLIGMPPALLRAATMYAVASSLTAAGRKYRTIDVIAFTFCVCAFGQPEAIRSVSFYLTYLAVLGITTGSRMWTVFFRRFVPQQLAPTVGVSVAAFSATAPVVVSSFGILYPFGIITSMILAPLVSLFLAVGFIVMVFDLFRPYRSISLDAVYLFLDALSKIIEKTAFSLSAIPGISVQTIWVVIISVFLWIYVRRRYGKHDQL